MLNQNAEKFTDLSYRFKKSRRKEYEWAILFKKVDSPFTQKPLKVFEHLGKKNFWENPSRLMFECLSAFTKEIANNKKVNTIWKNYKSSDPVKKLKERKIKNIGKRQTAFLRYVAKSFFRNGSPVFACQGTIGKAIGCNKAQVNVIIAKLVSMGYLLKMHWPSDTGKKHYIIVPSEPETTRIIFQIYRRKRQKIRQLFKSEIPNFDNKDDIPEGYILSYILSTFENQKYTSYTLAVPKPDSQDRSVSSCSGEDKSMAEKKQIKVKDSCKGKESLVKKIEKPLDRDKALSLGHDYLEGIGISNRQKKSLINTLEYHFDIPAKKIFGNIDSKEIYGSIERKLFDMLLRMYCEKTPLKIKWTVANLAINRFNSFVEEVPKFARTKINRESLVYLKTAIAVSYHLNVHLGLNSKALMTSLDSLKECFYNDPYLKFHKSLNLLTFLTDPKDKKAHEKYFQMTKEEIIIELRKRKPDFPVNCDVWKNLYAARYENADMGYKYFEMGQFRMTHFLDELCSKIIRYNLNLHGLKLLANTKCEETGIVNSPALELYLDFLANRFREKRHAMTVKIITEYQNWEDFVMYMREKTPYTRFWTFKKKDN